MSMLLRVMVGLVAGYIVGIAFAVVVARVLDFESAARFVAIGSAVAGAAMGPWVLDRARMGAD